MTCTVIRAEDGAPRCARVISGLLCAGRMEERRTRLPSDPGRLYCTRCGDDRPVPVMREMVEAPR